MPRASDPVPDERRRGCQAIKAGAFSLAARISLPRGSAAPPRGRRNRVAAVARMALSAGNATGSGRRWKGFAEPISGIGACCRLGWQAQLSDARPEMRLSAQLVDLFCEMAPRVGFEPTTNRLTAGCSTVELPRNAARASAVPCSRVAARLRANAFTPKALGCPPATLPMSEDRHAGTLGARGRGLRRGCKEVWRGNGNDRGTCSGPGRGCLNPLAIDGHESLWKGKVSLRPAHPATGPHLPRNNRS